MSRVRRRGFVAHVALDAPIAALEVPRGYDTVVVVVHQGRTVLGQFPLPARRRYEPEELRLAIGYAFGGIAARGDLREALRRALSPEPPAGASAPTVSVVVCTRNRVDQLRGCLESLLALRTPAHEILVVDNAPTDDATRRLCEDYPVRYLLEPTPGQTRARNRGIVESAGELVAFTDDDCIVDAGWLDTLAEAFRDPLTMAATGYIGPHELGHPAQLTFEVHMGFERHPEPRVFDPRWDSPLPAAAIAGAGANMVFRRTVFDRIGLFAEDLGPGTPARSSDDKYAFYKVLAAGFRIRYDPRRVIWHRHRADDASLRRIMEDYGVAEFAYTTRCLLEHRELSTLRVWRWWARHYVGDVRRHLRRAPGAVPLTVTRAEVSGALRGPLALRRSARSRREIPPIELPRARASGAPRPSAAVVAETPSVTVAIASRNRRERLAGVLDALRRQDLPPDRYEVVVVLDGTEDDSAAMVEAFEAPYRLRVVGHEHRGLAATRNRGAREAEHPVVVFLDDDIEPVPGFLAEHARAHAEAARDHLVLGAYPPARLGDGLWAISLRAWWTDHFRRKEQPGHRWSFADFIDGNSSVPRRLFWELGGFDERFTGGRRQDWELGVRMLAAGVPFAFRPQARGDHLFDTRLESGIRNARQEGRYDVLIASKHPHVKWQLPLGRRRLEPGVTTLPAALPAGLAGEATIAATLRLADALERLNLRRRWFKLVNRVLLRAYVRGIHDALASPETVRRFLTWDGDTRGEALRVRLDGAQMDGRLDGRAPDELLLTVGATPLARVDALGGDLQWDPEELIERVLDRAGDVLTAGLAHARLEERERA